MLAHLWKRNGIYYAIWYEGHTKKARQKSLKTRDEKTAEIRLKDFNRKMLAGKVKPIKPKLICKLSDFRIRFLEYIETEIEIGQIRESTYNLFKVSLDKAVKAWGPDKNLLNLCEEDLEHYQHFISKTYNIKKATVNKNYQHLKGALRKGQKWGAVNQKLHFPKNWKTTQTIRYLSKAELKKLIEKIPDEEFADLCMLSACSGMRSGEIIRLTARDIDNPPGFIRISAEQKNRQEDRIPINKEMRAIFNRYKRDIGPIFRWKKNYQISALFKKHARAAGFPDHRFHDLRHTFGAHLVMAGVDIRMVQQLMRHKSIHSTMVYTKLYPADLVEALNKLDFGIG